MSIEKLHVVLFDHLSGQEGLEELRGKSLVAVRGSEAEDGDIYRHARPDERGVRNGVASGSVEGRGGLRIETGTDPADGFGFSGNFGSVEDGKA